MMKVQYHVFTNGLDEWFDNYGQALVLYEQWSKEFSCARLYEERFDDEEFDGEDCLLATGDFPW